MIPKLKKTKLDPSNRKGSGRDGNRIPEERWDQWLEEFAKFGIGAMACDAVGISWNAIACRRRRDPEFEERFQEAKARGIHGAEDSCRTRAFAGYIEPVFNSKGEQIGERRVFSDPLAQFLLKGMRPEKYRERVSQENVNVNLNRELPHSHLSDEELEAEIKRRLR